MIRVIACGSRRWTDRTVIADTLFELVVTYGWRYPDPIIVHGAARGADRIAEEEAGKAGLLVEAHPADWERYGKRAGIVRNIEMADLGAEVVLAFWDGRSAGTWHMIETAHDRGIPVQVIRAASGFAPSNEEAKPEAGPTD